MVNSITWSRNVRSWETRRRAAGQFLRWFSSQMTAAMSSMFVGSSNISRSGLQKSA